MRIAVGRTGYERESPVLINYNSPDIQDGEENVALTD